MSKQNPGKISHERRYGDLTSEDIADFAGRLSDMAAEFTAISAVIDNAGYESITVDGVTKFGRGEKLIREFLLKIEIGIANAKLEQFKKNS